MRISIVFGRVRNASEAFAAVSVMQHIWYHWFDIEPIKHLVERSHLRNRSASQSLMREAEKFSSHSEKC